MLNYRGQFRVCSEIDNNYKPLDSVFIICGICKGANIYRHDNRSLSTYIPSLIIGKRLLKENPDIFSTFLQGYNEMILLFNETDINKVASVLKIKIKGSNISPKSKRNIKLVKKAGAN